MKIFSAKWLILLLALIPAMNGCENTEEKPESSEEAYVKKVIIEDSLKANNWHTFKAILGLPNPCYEHKRTVISKNDCSAYYQIMVNNPNDDNEIACITKPIADTIDIQFLLEHTGKFKLYFNDSLFNVV